MNSTSIGMHPAEEETPVNAEALRSYRVVFDAVYTPLQTRLLRVSTARPGQEGCVDCATQRLHVCTRTSIGQNIMCTCAFQTAGVYFGSSQVVHVLAGS